MLTSNTVFYTSWSPMLDSKSSSEKILMTFFNPEILILDSGFLFVSFPAVSKHSYSQSQLHMVALLAQTIMCGTSDSSKYDTSSVYHALFLQASLLAKELEWRGNTGYIRTLRSFTCDTNIPQLLRSDMLSLFCRFDLPTPISPLFGKWKRITDI